MEYYVTVSPKKECDLCKDMEKSPKYIKKKKQGAG